MSDARLICWPAGHGLALETRSGLYEALVDVKGDDVRLVNSIPVDAWPEHSRTAQRLEQLFQGVREKLVEMNRLRAATDDAGVTEYRRLYWEIRTILKGE